jgi:phospho-N-acetylmuramoyl-pentapeptide-transferase
VRGILVAAALALVVSMLGTAYLIKLFRRLGYGQEIREDGPQTHISKRGTPTMGGVAIIAATTVGYLGAHLVQRTGPTASGLLVLLAMVGLGAVGAADDLIKIYRQRSLGLNKRAKLAGQALVAIVFAVLAQRMRNGNGLTPASLNVSFVRDTGLGLGAVGFVVWIYLVFSGTSNGVNLTDGLDGLASGTSAMIFAAYVVISFYQFRNSCGTSNVTANACYSVRDPLDLALFSAAAMGACFGFLWWNATPARIFMGDTGSLGLGGAFAAVAVLSRTELLLMILGGLFVIEALSVIIQVGVFRATHGRKRFFRMAPIHHHFELLGWPETTVIVRFWIIAGLAVAFGLGVFYADYLARTS